MAKSNFNVVTKGLSGLIGDMLVFRQRGSKTLVSGKPKPFSKPPTANQLSVRHRFRRAAAYAVAAMSNLVLKAEYQSKAKPGQSAMNAAHLDYQKAPEFYEDVNLAAYTGAIGNLIEVSVLDDFRVESVQVQIKSSEGDIIEQGDAVQSPNGLDWIYTTTAVNAEVPGSRIIFTATDLPGNKTVLEKLMV